jgi:hypothetical protein
MERMRAKRHWLAFVICLVAAATQASAFAARAAAAQDRPKGLRQVSSETAPDAALEKALAEFLPEGAGGGPVRYYYNRVDLNGDGKPEVLAYLDGSAVCGTGGCTALVYEATARGYRLVSGMSLARKPIIVSKHRTAGWNDLVMYVSGGGIPRGFYATLRFRGRRYPDNPSTQAPLRRGARLDGVAYLADAPSPGGGIPLRAVARGNR